MTNTNPYEATTSLKTRRHGSVLVAIGFNAAGVVLLWADKFYAETTGIEEYHPVSWAKAGLMFVIAPQFLAIVMALVLRLTTRNLNQDCIRLGTIWANSVFGMVWFLIATFFWLWHLNVIRF